MAARLVPLDEGPTILLDRPITLIGRHPECDIRIDSKKVSRRHCCVVQLESRLIIRDLGSTNGIYYNGQRVEEVELSPDDEVVISNLRFQVVVDEEDHPTPDSVVQGGPFGEGAGEGPPRHDD
jgi:pSer/pThr/pTyr-binding forkhead associated (FHA) protein